MFSMDLWVAVAAFDLAAMKPIGSTKGRDKSNLKNA